MNYNYTTGYNQPYVQETVVVNSYGGRPYYNQPNMYQPSPQVVIVEERYNNGAGDAAVGLCAACCLMEMICCCLL